MGIANALLEAALGYVERGWRVLPLWWGEDGFCACPNPACPSPGKHPIAYAGRRPLAPNGVDSATTDAAVVRAWWQQMPHANVGIATGTDSFIVLDVDPRRGGDDTLHILEDSLGGLPRTPVAITGGGGQHILLDPAGEHVGNKTGGVGDWSQFPGLDVKGDGGYIVAPPSIHVSGGRYEWDAGAHPDDVSPAPIPEALRRRLVGPPQAGRNGTTLTPGDSDRVVTAHHGIDIGAVLAGVPEGARGVLLFKEAAKLRRVDVPYAWARQLVLASAAAADPPYPERAALKHLDSAYERYVPSEVPELVEAEGEEARGRFRLWTAAEMEAMPKQAWLVDNLLVENCITLLAAASRSFKTFLMLDIAASIAAGIDWHKRRVQGGPVVYISAEGRAGLGKRITAWRKARDIANLPRLFVLPETVRMIDAADVDDLLQSILGMREPPVLIVIDTLARCMAGGDENSSEDATLFVHACARLQQVTGATVVIVHHVNKQDGKTRGSSVFMDNTDAHLHVTREGDTVTVTCKKQKDFEEFSPLYFVREIVALDDGETSLVLRATRFTVDALGEIEQRVLQALRNLGGTAGSDGEWVSAAKGLRVSPTSYYRGRKTLLDQGYVTQEGGRFVITGLTT